MNPLSSLTTKAVSYIAAAIILPLLAYSIYAYLHIAGLKADYAKLDRNYIACTLSKAGLEIAVDEQNEAIEDYENRAKEAQKKSSAALEKAKKENSVLQGRIDELRESKGESCEDIKEFINEAIKL